MKVITAYFTLVLITSAINNLFGKRNGSCFEKRNYTACHLGSSCNPYDKDPCGCPYACCAPDDLLGKHKFNHALPFLYGYRCYKKIRCNQICGAMKRCGCETGLKCIKQAGKKIQRCVLKQQTT